MDSQKLTKKQGLKHYNECKPLTTKGKTKRNKEKIQN